MPTCCDVAATVQRSLLCENVEALRRREPDGDPAKQLSAGTLSFTRGGLAMGLLHGILSNAPVQAA